MKITYLSTLCLATVFSLSAEAQSSISAYKQCVDETRAELEKPREIEAYRDRGCTTGTADHKGKKDCHERVCWNADPHNLIVSAHVWDHSANGERHSYGETEYLPSREFATSICNTVSAKSKGIGEGRGWQKLSANVTVRRQITQAEREGIEAKCEKQVLGG